jgi:hypothetical protein
MELLSYRVEITWKTSSSSLLASQIAQFTEEQLGL